MNELPDEEQQPDTDAGGDEAEQLRPVEELSLEEVNGELESLFVQAFASTMGLLWLITGALALVATRAIEASGCWFVVALLVALFMLYVVIAKARSYATRKFAAKPIFGIRFVWNSARVLNQVQGRPSERIEALHQRRWELSRTASDDVRPPALATRWDFIWTGLHTLLTINYSLIGIVLLAIFGIVVIGYAIVWFIGELGRPPL